MNQDASLLEGQIESARRQHSQVSEAQLRKCVTWLGVFGTGLLGGFFFGFMMYETIYGRPEPTGWLVKLVQSHYAALIGTPMSAVTAFCIVSLLKVTSGPIEFEVLAFRFRGASGPIVLWVLCFLAVASAFRVLWPMAL